MQNPVNLPAGAEYRMFTDAAANVERGATITMIIAGVNGVQQVRMSALEAARIIGNRKAAWLKRASEEIVQAPELKERVNVVA